MQAIGKPLRQSHYTASQTDNFVEQNNFNIPEIPSINDTAMYEQYEMPAEQSALPVPDSVPDDVLQAISNIDVPQEEYTQEETEQPTPEPEEVVEEPKIKVSKQNEENIRMMRKAKEKAERERDEIFRLLQMQQLKDSMPKQQQQQEEEPDPFQDISDENLVEGKDVKRLYKEIKQLKNTIKNNQTYALEEQRRTQESILQSRILATCPDYSSVVTQDAIDAFKEIDPYTAASIAANPDPYSQAIAAYNVIKRSIVHTTPQSEINKKIVEKNLSKPKPAASINPQRGDSPLAKAHAFSQGMTDEYRDSLLREMQLARRG